MKLQRLALKDEVQYVHIPGCLELNVILNGRRCGELIFFLNAINNIAINKYLFENLYSVKLN